MNPVFYATVIKGTPFFEDDNVGNDFIKYLKSLEGKKVEVDIHIARKRRSNNQNAYYWGVVIKLLQEPTGYLGPDGADELHEILKSKFLTVHTRYGDRVKDTSGLNTAEFEEYLDNIRNWAAVMFSTQDDGGGFQPFVIPLPNEVALT
jgi:hypothetical protein